MYHQLMKFTTRKLIETSSPESWRVYGFGMMRYYIDPGVSIHVWDQRLMIPNVSTIHDHPWGFDSLVLVGSVNNTRYTIHRDERSEPAARKYNGATIRCGAGACVLESPQTFYLKEQPVEWHAAGSYYHQDHDEIHRSHPNDGTVTIISRVPVEGVSRDNARVFWPAGTEWVSAEPRPATLEEFTEVTRDALFAF